MTTDIIAEFYASIETEYRNASTIYLIKVPITPTNIDCLQGYIVGVENNFLISEFGASVTKDTRNDATDLLLHLKTYIGDDVLFIKCIDEQFESYIHFIMEVKEYNNGSIIVSLGRFERGAS